MNQLLKQFSKKYDLALAHYCENCKREHFAEKYSVIDGYAIIEYEQCPKNAINHIGPFAMTPISKKDKQEYIDLYWNLRRSL